MKVLIIGSGAREHALAWKISQDPKVSAIFVAPGNAGSALEAKIQNLDLAIDDLDNLLAFSKENAIDITLVGPEVPLVLGIVDRFNEAGLAIFGPSQKAAQLEGSKAFSKDFLSRHQIPTASYGVFTELTAAKNYLKQQSFPIVIKADGLAAGKGVIIAENIEQANLTVTDMLCDDKFGTAGRQVVIEEFLQGQEASFIVVSDGKTAIPLASSQDYKRIGEGDTGPNTGGMGACSPAPIITKALQQRVMQDIIQPTIDGMAKEGAPYQGFLYAGLMIEKDGSPKVIEFNCRLGDPETQPIMLRLNSSLIELCQKALQQELSHYQTEWTEQAAMGVVISAQGYPQSSKQGDTIKGLEQAANLLGKVFYAGVKEKDGVMLTQGGRVLTCCALGENLAQAQTNAYQLAECLNWPGSYYRKDIGYLSIELETEREKLA